MTYRGAVRRLIVCSCLLVGCNGDDTPPKFFDSGTDVDATNDADASDASTVHAKIIAVNASADLGTVKLCFGFGFQNDGSDSKVAAIAPVPRGSIIAGGGQPLPDLGLDLSTSAVTPYAVLTSSIGTSAQTCDALIQSLAAGMDYFAMPTIKNGTLAAGTTVMLAMTGCVPAAIDGSGDATTCGPTYDPSKGNLAASAFSLDKVIGNSSRFGTQVVHAASATSGVWFTLYGTHALTALLRPQDGGADEIIADGVLFQQIAPTSAASLAMPVIDQTSLVMSADNGDAGGQTTIPLPLVYEATTGQATGENAYFVAGANYTFVVTGDPRVSTTLDGGIFNGYSLHALAFPNDPPLPNP
jgi:hypothetical protein